MNQIYVWIFSLTVLGILFYCNNRSIQKIKAGQSIKGFFTINEKIEFKTKLNEINISLLKDVLVLKGEMKTFEVKYTEIKELVLYDCYSKVFSGAAVEIRYDKNSLLLAATSLVLFKNFVVGKRMATLAIYNQLSERCTDAIKSTV